MHRSSQITLPVGTPLSPQKRFCGFLKYVAKAPCIFSFALARCSSGQFKKQLKPNKRIMSLAFGSLGRATAARRPAPYTGR